MVNKGECHVLLSGLCRINLTIEMFIRPSAWARWHLDLLLKLCCMTIKVLLRNKLIIVESNEPQFAIVKDNGQNYLLINCAEYEDELHIFGEELIPQTVGFTDVQDGVVLDPIFFIFI